MFPLCTDVRRTPQVLRLFVRSGALESSPCSKDAICCSMYYEECLNRDVFLVSEHEADWLPIEQPLQTYGIVCSILN